jgi:hypothetical protein
MQRTLERIAAALVALELATIVAATSSNWHILNFDRTLRWLLLAALVGVTALLVWRGWSRPRRAVAPAWLALAFVGLALLSTAWSAAGGLTYPHAISLGVLLFVVAGLTYQASRERVELLLWAVVGGAALVAIAGAVLLVVARHTALEPASVQYATRYRGLGGNPDTAPLLLAIALPAALAFALRGRKLGWAAVALFVASIAPSASRGALVASVGGSLAVAWILLPAWRTRGLAVVAILGVAVVSVGVSKIPKPLPPTHQKAKPAFSPNAELVLPLNTEPGYGGATDVFVRSLTSSSGRVIAWKGALRQARDRIVAGYGFGTEDRVFVDRYPIFFANRVENAYLGTLLELGIVGLLLLLVLLGAIARDAVRALRRGGDRLTLAGSGGAFVAGTLLAVVQSYLWSVGGTGSLAMWLAAALLVAASSQAPNSA